MDPWFCLIMQCATLWTCHGVQSALLGDVGSSKQREAKTGPPVRQQQGGDRIQRAGAVWVCLYRTQSVSFTQLLCGYSFKAGEPTQGLIYAKQALYTPHLQIPYVLSCSRHHSGDMGTQVKVWPLWACSSRALPFHSNRKYMLRGNM